LGKVNFNSSNFEKTNASVIKTEWKKTEKSQLGINKKP